MATNSNKKRGNSFEQELCEKLAANGFWAHNMAQNAAGQPADVIAVRDGKAYLIDCKVCTDNRFAFSRCEENQMNAMALWRDCGNGYGWFALRLADGDIYMLSSVNIKSLSLTTNSLSGAEIRWIGIQFEEWVSK